MAVWGTAVSFRGRELQPRLCFSDCVQFFFYYFWYFWHLYNALHFLVLCQKVFPLKVLCVWPCAGISGFSEISKLHLESKHIFAHCNQDDFPTWYLLHPQILNRGAWDWIKFPGWVIVLVHPWLLSKGPEFTVYLHLNKWGLATSKDPHFRCDISPLQRNFDDPRFHWWLLGGQKTPHTARTQQIRNGRSVFHGGLPAEKKACM